MTGVSMELKVEGIGEAEEQLGALEGRVADRSPLMAQIAAYLEASTVQRFATNVGPDGKPWKPSIRAQLSGGRTLVQRGLLRDSFVSDSGEDFAEVGTNDPRARPHQFGATITPKSAKVLRFKIPGVGWRAAKKVTLPARPMVGLSQGDRASILDLTGDYLAGGLGTS